MAQTVKNLPATQETQARSLDPKDPLKENMATHSSILAWRIPWTEEPGGLPALGLQRVGYDWATNTLYILLFDWYLEQPHHPPLKNKNTQVHRRLYSCMKENANTQPQGHNPYSTPLREIAAKWDSTSADHSL